MQIFCVKKSLTNKKISVLSSQTIQIKIIKLIK